jgi:hypothetical protein
MAYGLYVILNVHVSYASYVLCNRLIRLSDVARALPTSTRPTPIIAGIPFLFNNFIFKKIQTHSLYIHV